MCSLSQLQDELDKLAATERPKTAEEKEEEKKQEEEHKKELSDIEIKDGDYQVSGWFCFCSFESPYMLKNRWVIFLFLPHSFLSYDLFLIVTSSLLVTFTVVGPSPHHRGQRTES